MYIIYIYIYINRYLNIDIIIKIFRYSIKLSLKSPNIKVFVQPEHDGFHGFPKDGRNIWRLKRQEKHVGYILKRTATNTVEFGIKHY